MREIKFRAWDTQGKKMLFTGFHVIGEVTAFGLIDDYCFKTKGDKTSMERWNDIELMQYTGLKDKNGVEIYEGDVLKWQMTQPEYECGWCWIYGVVEFGQGSFRYSMVADGCEWLNLPMVDNSCVLMGGVESHEIIGNIYSNPELITSRKRINP